MTEEQIKRLEIINKREGKFELLFEILAIMKSKEEDFITAKECTEIIRQLENEIQTTKPINTNG